jgi:hypothetical protein
MTHEFNNRIAAQRTILQIVNRSPWPSESLTGLSRHAIDRWISVNRIDPGSRLPSLINDVSGKLFFLANKSQEQISEDYRAVSHEVEALAGLIATEIETSVVHA